MIILPGALTAGTTDRLADRIDFWGGVDAGYVYASGHPSWTESSGGKLRYTNGHAALRGFGELRGRLTDTLSLTIAAEVGRDSTPQESGITQAYLAWNPIPRSSIRHRFRVGAFYPQLSLEHTQPGWTNRHTLSGSALATWIAEELRTFGLEWRGSTRLSALGTHHNLALSVSAFTNNDPTGSLLAWRGWSLHDRQSTLRDRLPLATLPLNRPGEVFAPQAPFTAPFREVDNRLGYAATAQYRYRSDSIFQVGYYDNRGDPTALEDGQYAWNTRFAHVGVELPFAEDWVFVSQWLRGSTSMGPVFGGRNAVDAQIETRFALLGLTTQRGNAAIRVDQFDVDDRDQLVADNNNERGRALTLFYRHRLTDNTSLVFEYLNVRTERPIWEFNNLDPVETESQVQLRAQFRF
ncbi:MAG: hypothetical protein AAGA23_02550 [Pseudomonadota bacterium]